MTDTETNIVHFTPGQPGLEGDLHLIGYGVDFPM